MTKISRDKISNISQRPMVKIGRRKMTKITRDNISTISQRWEKKKSIVVKQSLWEECSKIFFEKNLIKKSKRILILEVGTYFYIFDIKFLTRFENLKRYWNKLCLILSLTFIHSIIFCSFKNLLFIIQMCFRS